MLLSSLLNATFLSAGSKGVDVEQLLSKLLDWGIEVGKDLLGAIIIYIVGRFIIKQVGRLLARILEKRKLEISVQTFLRSLVSILLNLILAFAIVSRLGVETTSFAALLASAGVAIGMALSGNLSNFAGGLIILVFKPHTILTTVDNKVIYVPNGALSSNAITNYSKQETRRAEWVFGVEYGEDFEKVKAVLQRIIDADPRILKDPAPMIALGALSASSVDIKVRAWAKTADYWDVYFDMNKIVYDTFNKEGIGFPFPQLTVHQAKD